ncbi:MAG: hypothetical protein OEL66_00320 [Desulfobulbaceae bacterium]|nr:hypothetical protein [Desulfobulbaceae bacterium]
MNINNEKEAHEAIEAWRCEPEKAQLRNLQQAVEKLELGQMYYDQKGNEQGSERLARCLDILVERKKEIDCQIQS